MYINTKNAVSFLKQFKQNKMQAAYCFSQCIWVMFLFILLIQMHIPSVFWLIPPRLSFSEMHLFSEYRIFFIKISQLYFREL